MKVDNERLARRISVLAGSCQENRDVLERAAAVKKMLDAYNDWDGRPVTLKTNAFTMEELYIALEEITNMEEYESNQNIQPDNAASLIISARSIISCLLEVPPVRKKVTYL